MKRSASVISAILVFLSAMSAGTSPAPDSVVMPWESFNALRNRASDTPAERSARFAYEKALYTGVAEVKKDEYHIRFAADVIVNTFGNTEILVPFLSRQLNMESLSVNGVQSTWIDTGEFYLAMIPEAGRHEIRSEFTVILDANRWPRNVYLPLVMIPTTEVIIDVPDKDIEAGFDQGAALETVSLGNGNRIRGYVPAATHVNIRWLKRNVEKEEVPLKMVAATHTYISLGENGATCDSDIAFRILQGETNFFKVLMPDTVDILDLSAADAEGKISQWFAEDVENGRMVHIYTSYRQSKTFKAAIAYERTETRSNYRFAVPNPEPQGVDRIEELVSVGAESNVEINEADAEHVERRDVRFLPDEIERFAKGRALFYYKALEKDFDLEFTVKSHDKATLVKTRIEKVDADSVLTNSGRLMTKIAYHVKNNQAQFLKIVLPKSAKFLSAFLSGREIQPAVDGSAFLLPIEKSAEASFPVEIAYLDQKGEGFGSCGGIAISLPETDVPIGTLSWRLHTPTGYQIIWFGGNVERRERGLGARMNWLLGKAFSGTGPAYAGLGYQKYEYSEKGLKSRFKKKGKKRVSDRHAVLESSNQVRVLIPVTGTRYTFGSYLIKNFTPKIEIYYVNSVIRKSAMIAVSATFFLMALWWLFFIFEKEILPGPMGKPRTVIAASGIPLAFLILLAVYSFGIGKTIADSMAFAVLGFALWQNRHAAGKYKGPEPQRRGRVSKGILFILFLSLIALSAMFISGLPAGAAIVVLFIIAMQYGIEKGSQINITLFRKREPDPDENRPNEKDAGTTIGAFFIACLGGWLLLNVLSVPALAGGGAADFPELKGTELGIPLEELEQMLEKIRAKEKYASEKPEAEYLFGTVRITGQVTGKFAKLKFEAPLAILSSEYVKIPIFDASTAITDARLNGESLALNRDSEDVWFEARRESEELGSLEVDVFVPVREKGGVNQFSVKSPLVRGGLADLSFGREIKSVRLFGVVWQERDGQKVTAALGRDRELRGELATFIRKKETADETAKRVKKIYSTTYTLVSMEDEVATFYSSIRYKILNDLVREFTVRLPKDAVVHEIVGEDVEKWSKIDGDGNTATYQVKVLYPVAFRYDLSVQYEKPLGEPGTPFQIPALEVAGVARDVGYIGVEMQSQAEIDLSTLKKARLIDIRELPSIIRSDAYSPFVYALRYVERPYEIAFEIKKHANYDMDPAIADRISYVHVISPKGRVMSQVKMWIRNSQKQYASFILPEKASAMSTFLDGRSVKPSLGENGELLLPLKRQSMTPFMLDVIYEDASIAPSALFGEVNIRYPKLDIPASIVESEVYVPENMWFTDPWGDMGKSKSVGFVEWRSEQAQRPDERLRQQMAYQHAIQNQQAMNMNNMPVMQQERAAPEKPGGTHSLKITLPIRGNRFSMNTLYAPAGVSLETGFYLYRSIFRSAGYVAGFLALAFIGLFLGGWQDLSNGKRAVLVAVFCVACHVVPYAWKECLAYAVLGIVIRLIGRAIRKVRIQTPAET